MDLLLLAIAILRLVLPSLVLSLLLVQGLTQALIRLQARLQASSFLESSSDYRRVPSSISPTTANNRNSVILPPDANGILPVVVPIRNYRRWLIYSLVSLTVFSYLADAVVFIAHSIVSNAWQSTANPFWKHQEFYVLGSAVGLAGQALIMAWQERKRGLGGFKTVFPVTVLCVLLAGEIALTGTMARKLQLDSKKVHTWETVTVASSDGWTIAHLSMQGGRILMLLLGLLAFTPMFKRTEFKPNEYRSLLGAQEDGDVPAAASTSNGNGSYGTFNGTGNGSARNSKPSSVKGPSAPGAKDTGKAPIPEESKHSFWQRIKILSPYLWPKKSRTLQAVALFCFLLLGVGRVVNLFVPRTLGKLVEELSVREAPWKHLLLYCGLRFMQGSGGVIQVISSNLWAPVAQYSEREMSQMTFSHLLNLSLSFQVKKKTGEVLRTLDRGSAINSFFQVLLFQLVPIAVDILIAIIYLWATFGLLLASLVTVIMTAYVITSVVLTRLRVKYRRDMNEKDKYTRGILADALANWETIKYFTAEEREQTRYVNSLKEYQRAEYKVIASLNFLNLMQNAIISLGLVTGSLIVAFTVVQGTRTVGQFVMFLTYLTQLYGPLNSLGMLYRMIQTNLTDTDNLMKLLAEETEITDKPGAEELVNAKGGIELDHVNFSYDGRMTALKDISVKIAPGTSVALVGESGAGKSTLLRLLYRFYEVTGGSIRFDGKDIRDVTQTSLRRAIGVVPQEAVLFNEGIAYNIGYGKDGATQQDIEEAAKAARIYERILSFPDGWDTKVGERGVRLSGGEKQRVSIARAILKNPAILLLDEATSALDTGTEREIQQSLRHLAEGRTSIAIAHRLSTITYCDLILVLNDGEIAEQGDHKTLLAQRGLYYNLWNKQIRAEEEAVEEVKEAIAEGTASAAEARTDAGGSTHAHP